MGKAARSRRPERSTRVLISGGDHHPPAARAAAGGLTARAPAHEPGAPGGPPLSEEDAEAHVINKVYPVADLVVPIRTPTNIMGLGGMSGVNGGPGIGAISEILFASSTMFS